MDTRTTKHIALAVALLALAPARAYAASGNASNASGSAGATLVAPIVVSHVAGAALKFGTFTVGVGGTVVVSPTGASSVTGSVTLAPGSINAADGFAVSGDPGRNFSITTSVGSVTSSAGNIVFVTQPSATQATLGPSGTGTFTVGGTLLVGSNILPGVYKGTYTATVAYD